MWLTRTFKLIGASFLLAFFSLSFAGKNNEVEPAAVITFNNPGVAKLIVFAAYKTITHMDKPIYKLLNLAEKSIAEADSTTTDFDYLNLKFQAKKQEISDVLLKSKISMSSLFRHEMAIEIKEDGFGNHLMFFVPAIDFSDLLRNSISSVDEANKTIAQLAVLIQKIDNALPSTTSHDQLNKFTNPEALPQLSSNEMSRLTIMHAEDSRAILKTLIALEQNIKSELHKLLALAQLAANGKHTEQEMEVLDNEYGQRCWLIFMSVLSDDYNPLRNIRLFHDISLNFEMNGKTREYFFPQIDLVSLNLDTDNILYIDAAILSIRHTIFAITWMIDWSITGSTRLSEIDRNDLLKTISLVHLDPKLIVVLEKHFGKSVLGGSKQLDLL
ncbi:hypothetical protein OQJ13_07510 [Legionella sp. PATHC035]|uniref:hypothetical protein n=1 Tax=Legionella sp. PATHC035 TaxID=2992040 RepID=UPI002243221E|nr:hypothetical protein [Legionella sp. PATHC035]MCW8408816.1 hypothetical protein [Legionella sp. PATHC035]